jgi:hypothetical protein
VQGWSSLNLLFVGMADGSFWGGSFHQDLVSATTSLEVEQKLRQHAPEVLELLLEENPNFAEDFVKRPPNSSGSAIILSRFHHDNILLIGDAAHAMVCLQDLRHIYSCQTVFCQFLRDRKQVLGTFRKGCAIGYREGSNKGNYYTLVIALVRGSSEFLEFNCWTKQQHLYFCVCQNLALN